MAALAAMACAAPALCASAWAQERWPDRPVRLIVPTSPGAVTDILARAIGQALSESWGQPVIIDNRPGADEMLGNELVAKAVPDGLTLGVVSNAGITAAPFLHKDLRYDPARDLTAIMLLGEVTPVVVVSRETPAATWQEFVAYAKSKPGQLNYGSFGNGTYAHVAMEELKQRTGIQLTHIVYRGATPAYLALLRNEISVMIANLGGAAAQAEAGTVNIIAAAGARRPQLRPDLPTIAESGVPGFSTGAWWALIGPANLSAAIVTKLRTDVANSLAASDVQKIYRQNTLEREDLTAEQFAQFIKDDRARWERQIKGAGITPD
jgi:tripartite-type tricarboxylate transporter receptor subunit TctC